MRLFKADLNEEGSFDEAVKGCDGVFHVAASMQFSVVEKENMGNAIHGQCFQWNFKYIQVFFFLAIYGMVNNETLCTVLNMQRPLFKQI